VGSRCEFTCDKRLHHVFCNPISNKCDCEKNYPVKIGKLRVSLDNDPIQKYLFPSLHQPYHVQKKVFAKAVQNVSALNMCCQAE
jgi:hypothetical protein